jgi:hypothetical protein
LNKLSDAGPKKACKEGISPMPAYDKRPSDKDIKDIDNVIPHIRTFAGK